MPYLIARVPNSIPDQNTSVVSFDIVKLSDDDFKMIGASEEVLNNGEKLGRSNLTFEGTENWALEVLAQMLEELSMRFGVLNYDGYPGVDFFSIELPKPIPLDRNSNEGGFGQHLDELKTALLNLSNYLRGINDPDILTTELKTTRSYIDASLCFFDGGKYPSAPDEVPAEIAQGLGNQIKQTDWTKTSAEARGWAKTILDAIVAYFKYGAS